MDAILQSLQEQAGIHFVGVPDVALQMDGVAGNIRLAMDAQPSLVTTSNSGIPAFLSTYIDPKMIEILVAPMKAAEIVGDEIKKGDWTTETAMFPVVESTGETSSYGDYAESGQAGANVNFPQRQSYHYQVITQWGERELEKAALARIDWANRINIASVLTLNKFQNKTYFFGVAGLQNYGLLNDPSLLPSISPLVKYDTATGSGSASTAYTAWANASALDVYADVQALYAQLVLQANGLVELDMSSEMTLVMSPELQVALTKTSIYNVNVKTMLQTNFPKMKFETAPEYATTAGNLVQLIVGELAGERTASTAFTEKLRAHPIVVKMSSFQQKKSQGTWGTIIRRPFLIASLLGC
jgi:hypothetical protein